MGNTRRVERGDIAVGNTKKMRKEVWLWLET